MAPRAWTLLGLLGICMVCSAPTLAMQSSYSVAAAVAARQYFEAGENAAALQSAQEAIKLDPKAADAYVVGAKAALALKQFAEAERISSQGITSLQETKIKKELEQLLADSKQLRPVAFSALQGQTILNGWSALSIKEEAQSIYLKLPESDVIHTPKARIMHQWTAFRAFVELPTQTYYLPWGTHPDLERIADLACDRKPKDETTVAALQQDLSKDGSPYRFLFKGPAETPKTSFAAFVISCAAPEHERLAYRLQQSGLSLVQDWSTVILEAGLKMRARSSESQSLSTTQPKIDRLYSKLIYRQTKQIEAITAWVDTQPKGVSEEELKQLKADSQVVRRKVVDQFDALKIKARKINRSPLTADDWRYLEYLYKEFGGTG